MLSGGAGLSGDHSTINGRTHGGDCFIAAYIAWQQHQLGKRQFKHELYDRRLTVFQAAKSFLSDITRDGRARFHRVVQFNAEASEAEFLFGDDIVGLIDELYEKGLKLAELYDQLYPESGEPGLPVGEERSRVAKEKSEVLKEMIHNLGELKQAFKPYLGVH